MRVVESIREFETKAGVKSFKHVRGRRLCKGD